jgi:hypothetical protein
LLLGQCGRRRTHVVRILSSEPFFLPECVRQVVTPASRRVTQRRAIGTRF